MERNSSFHKYKKNKFKEIKPLELQRDRKNEILGLLLSQRDLLGPFCQTGLYQSCTSHKATVLGLLCMLKKVGPHNHSIGILVYNHLALRKHYIKHKIKRK